MMLIKIFLMFAVSLFVMCSGEEGKACARCDTWCSLLPPSDVVFPCYQGTPDDAATCFATDPLLQPNTTWSCGVCTDFGFPKYLRNDPIYTKMELWSK